MGGAFQAVSTPHLNIFLKGCGRKIAGLGKTLFLLGGRQPDAEWLRSFVRMNLPDIWAVDSGVRSCRESRLHPSVVIGDMDSANPDDWAWARQVGAREHLHEPAKDLTDFQLALDLWDASTMLVVSGCFGGRLDHLTSALSTFAAGMKKKKKKRARCMIDEREGVFLLHSGEAAELEFVRSPLAISLLPITNRCRGVSIEGVAWPLDGVTLERCYPWAISNVLRGPQHADGAGDVAVRCEEGTLAVYWCFAE